VSYMVIYGDPQGARELLEIDELSAAIELVEQLRNEQEVDDVRLLETTELAFGFKPYYHVELSTAAAGDSASSNTDVEHNWSQPADWSDSTVGALDSVVDSGTEMSPASDSGTPEPATVGSSLSTGELSTSGASALDGPNGGPSGPSEDLVWGSSVASATEVSDAKEADDAPQRRGLFNR
jgi:hypothetical protein